MSTMPKQRPGLSKQDYGTPPEYLNALKQRLGIDEFYIDLAADHENTVAPRFYSEEDDALVQSWVHPGWAFCNPPYANIQPWVAKAALESQRGGHIAMLLPASVGSNWWALYVEHHAYQLFMKGRVTFVGETTCYPKDTVTLLYTKYIRGGNQVWAWTS